MSRIAERQEGAATIIDIGPRRGAAAVWSLMVACFALYVLKDTLLKMTDPHARGPMPIALALGILLLIAGFIVFTLANAAWIQWGRWRLRFELGHVRVEAALLRTWRYDYEAQALQGLALKIYRQRGHVSGLRITASHRGKTVFLSPNVSSEEAQALLIRLRALGVK